MDPDFVVRLSDDTFLVVETKGLEDLEVALKDKRARRWCLESGSEWVTTDRGFARFPGLRWRHPLAA